MVLSKIQSKTATSRTASPQVASRPFLPRTHFAALPKPKIARELAQDVFTPRFGQMTPANTPKMDLNYRLMELGTFPSTKDKLAIRVAKAFTDKDTPDLTYGQLFNAIRQTTAGLKTELGLKPGDAVAIADTNTLDFVIQYFAILAAGGIATPLNLLALQDEGSRTEKLMHMLAKPNAKAFIIGADPTVAKMQTLVKAQKLQQLKCILGPMIEHKVEGKAATGIIERIVAGYLSRQLKTPQQWRDLQTAINGLPKGIKLVTPARQVRLSHHSPIAMRNMTLRPASDTPADILYTSGTTGNPKGVPHTHGSLAFTTQSVAQGTKEFASDHDVTLMALPLFHIFGKAVFTAQLLRPSPIVLLPSLRNALDQLDKVVDTIEQEKITLLPAVPVFLEKLEAYLSSNPEAIPRVQSLRMLISGGAPLKEKTYYSLKQMIPNLQICEGYGSTEGGISNLNTSGKYGFIGKALPGVEEKIVNPDPDTGAGELWVKSPGIAKKYLAGTASEDAQKVFTEDGWFKTGDIVRMDASTQMFQVVDRESDILKIAGERRSPASLEEAVKRLSFVKDAMAIAYKPDRVTEKAVLIVASSDPMQTEASIKVQMQQLLNEKQIAGWMIPKHIVVLPQAELPKGFVGFKRQYAAGRDFVKKLVQVNLVQFVDDTGGDGKIASRTVVSDPNGLKNFTANYDYAQVKK